MNGTEQLRVVVAHMDLARSVKPADRELAQKECASALAEYRIAHGKMTVHPDREMVLRKNCREKRSQIRDKLADCCNKTECKWRRYANHNMTANR